MSVRLQRSIPKPTIRDPNPCQHNPIQQIAHIVIELQMNFHLGVLGGAHTSEATVVNYRLRFRGLGTVVKIELGMCSST